MRLAVTAFVRTIGIPAKFIANERTAIVCVEQFHNQVGNDVVLCESLSGCIGS